jgi:hypothetical protein
VVKLRYILLILIFAFESKAQKADCTLKKPQLTIHFGYGNVRNVNTVMSYRYERVSSYCPTDGHYTYTPYTSDCFSGDWYTLTEDHTSGDVGGNMLLVNSSPGSGMFLRTAIHGLKTGTTYEFAVWLMNVCKITDKCPFPLLPDITIYLQTTAGKNVAQFNTGEVSRYKTPLWKQYRFFFTTPPSATNLNLIMINNAPGGCGNDFALDDITFRECIKPPPVVSAPLETTAAPKKQSATLKPVVKKLPPKRPVNKQAPDRQIAKLKIDSLKYSSPSIKLRSLVFPPPPSVLTARTNALVKQIETETGEIKIDLYDNGEIDDDTVSIYHNNSLLAAHARLSQDPITFRISVDEAHPHHELIMVADNLGSIPPNTSLMVVTAGTKRYEVFISSTKQKNAKVVLDLKE